MAADLAEERLEDDVHAVQEGLGEEPGEQREEENPLGAERRRLLGVRGVLAAFAEGLGEDRKENFIELVEVTPPFRRLEICRSCEMF